jgi:hypothetical protein
MALQPALEGLVGLATDARLMRVSLRPYLPGSWDGLSIDHLTLGEERLDVRIERKRGKMNFWFRTKAKGPIAVSLQMLLPLGSVLRSRTVGRATTPLSGLVNAYADSPVVSFTLTGHEKGSVQYTEGVALEPGVVLPKQGFPSSGVRCLDERMDAGNYTLVLEGPDEQTCSVVLRDPAERIIQVRGAADWARQGERVLVTLDGQGPLQPTGYRRTRVSVELASKRQ